MKKKTLQKRNDIITASEINQYLYCSIAWNLQRTGHVPISPLLEIGKKAHVDLGKTIDNIQYELRWSRRFELVGYLLLIFAICIIIFRVIL